MKRLIFYPIGFVVFAFLALWAVAGLIKQQVPSVAVSQDEADAQSRREAGGEEGQPSQQSRRSEYERQMVWGQAKERWRMTPEEARLQSQNWNKVVEQLEKFKTKTGRYPESLKLLERNGYPFPKEPCPGWVWAYKYPARGGLYALNAMPE